MFETTRRRVTATVAMIALMFSGCGGGNSTPQQQAPSFTSPLPSTATVNDCSKAASWPVAVSGQPAPSITATVTSGTGDASYAGGNVTYTPVCSNSDATITVMATASNGVSPNATSSVTVNVPAQKTPPTISLTCPATKVGTSQSMNCNYMATGNPAPTVTATAVSGSAVVTTGQVTYTAPASVGNGTDTLSVKASNGVNPDATESVSFTVFDSQVPVISGTDGPSFYNNGGGGYSQFDIFGSNFAADDSYGLSPQPSVWIPTYVNPTNLTLFWTFDAKWDPGRYDFTDTNSHGSSNPLHLVQRSHFGMMACSPATSANQCYLLDSVNNLVYSFDRTSGAKTNQRDVSQNMGQKSKAKELVYDDANKVLIVHDGRSIAMYQADGSGSNLFGGVGQEVAVNGFAAGFGQACFSDVETVGANKLWFFSTATSPSHLQVGPSDMAYVTIASGSATTVPSTVGMNQVSGQVVCTVYDTREKQLASFNVPQGTKRYQVSVTGLADENNTGFGGGWWDFQLADGKNVLVSSNEKVAILFDASGNEVSRSNLTGTAVSATLLSSGQVAIAEYDDPVSGVTAFELFDPVSGKVTASAATIVTLFPTGLYGTAAGNRQQYLELKY